jgi:lipoprotein-releasing system ATP-binding protein
MAILSKTNPVPATPSTTQPLLRARGIRKNFRMGDSEVQVIKGADFALRSGEFVAVEGRSGSGKSTLLHILGGLDSADAGKLEFDGADFTVIGRADGKLLESWKVTLSLAGFFVVAAIEAFRSYVIRGENTWAFHAFVVLIAATVASAAALIVLVVSSQRRERPIAKLRNSQFGFVFQFYHLLPELNVLENTMLAPMIEYSWLGFRGRRAVLRQRATDILDELGMSHRLKHRPAQLSGGERQRVAIARALMNQPRILFADEPTGNLDVETGSQIMGVLAKLHRDRGQTIVMVTHDRTIAHQADRVLVLRDGRLQTPAESAEIHG